MSTHVDAVLTAGAGHCAWCAVCADLVVMDPIGADLLEAGLMDAGLANDEPVRDGEVVCTGCGAALLLDPILVRGAVHGPRAA